MKFKILTAIAILLSLYMVKTFWKESPLPKVKTELTARTSDDNSSTPINEWAYENPLDFNYALIQRRIDFVLNGDKDVADTEKLLKEDAQFLMLLTQITPPLSPVFFLLGQVELILKDYPKAIKALAAYTALEPQNIWGWKLLALAQMGEKDNKAAIETFKSVIKINPIDLSAWKSLGKLYESEGSRDLAIAAYKKASLMSPSDPEIQAALK